MIIQKLSNNTYNISVLEKYNRQNSTLDSIASELGEHIITSFEGSYYYIIEYFNNNTIAIIYHLKNNSVILIPFYFPFQAKSNNITFIVKEYNSSNELSLNYTTTAEIIASSNYINITYNKLNFIPYYFIISNMSYKNDILHYYSERTSLLINGTPAFIQVSMKNLPTSNNYDKYIILSGIIVILVASTILVIRKKIK
ncbi:hypothetical protein [Acidianus manzaensis]|uniref:Uncharacterized protein n=1 Tax=Acidianus manzaensis TaxID=282676 RepID=A0A1W6JYY2_9CREN|nr:hypothetical protein [Acidianus manzaensis]ARM75479.1 hypothetical protein B6F84_05160 [Acidianus manzaensis]